MGVYVMAGPEPRPGRRLHLSKRLTAGSGWTTAIKSLRIALALVAGVALAAVIVGAAALA
jgi:hypothetical protein